MTEHQRHYADPELDAMEELGAIERRHRQMARKLGVHHHALRAVWVLLALGLIGAAFAVWMVLR